MTTEQWPTKRIAVATLNLDAKNPRLRRDISSSSPKDIIQHLFDHDKALDVAESIAIRGFFPNEPLLAVKEDGRYVVIEGNRRLAALKALRDPSILGATWERSVGKLARRIENLNSIASVPVTLAPSRRATDRQIAGRHIGTAVLSWQAENRAHFILDKLNEGYDNDELSNVLGFSPSDIQKARQTKAIADMARVLTVAPEVRAKLTNPRTSILTTIERVFDSTVGREFLRIEPDEENGIRGTTSKEEFLRGFTKLVVDVATGKQSSRSLNKNTDIRRYFNSWAPTDLPKAKRDSFFPADVLAGKSERKGVAASTVSVKTKKSKPPQVTVLPKSFKVVYGTDRLVDIRRELTRIRRSEYPNAGAVLLRVFFELSVMDYLERSGELPGIIAKLSAKSNLPHGVPTMRQLVPEITRIAKKRLSAADARKVEKAIRYDPAAPFTISDLHAFVHHAGDLPSERDIFQFWVRTEPLFRMMLEQEVEAAET